MHILLTGGTGLIGRALCNHWAQQGHQLTVCSRSPQQVPGLCGAQVRGIGQLEELGDVGLDAVVNLAGAPIADRPWTRKRKTLLWASRISLTEQLLAWLKLREQKPQVLLSGSAVGAWEETAQRAEDLGIRVVLVRTGLVLAKDGGFLKRLLLPFKLGLGGPLGDGRQWMSWVHLADQVALIDFLLQQPQARGPYNACAPEPVRNADFARSLGHVLHRPAILPAPALLLRVGLGELSALLLGGQRALPLRLREAGFTFRFTDLDTALEDLLGRH